MNNPKAIQNLKPFPKGQSGNRAGRPKGARSRSAIIRQLLALKTTLPLKTLEQLQAVFPDLPQALCVEDVVTLLQIDQARRGDTRAYIALMDSAYGRVVKAVEPISPVVQPDAEEDLSHLTADQLRQRLDLLKDREDTD